MTAFFYLIIIHCQRLISLHYWFPPTLNKHAYSVTFVPQVKERQLHIVVFITKLWYTHSPNGSSKICIYCEVMLFTQCTYSYKTPPVLTTKWVTPIKLGMIAQWMSFSNAEYRIAVLLAFQNNLPVSNTISAGKQNIGSRLPISDRHRADICLFFL